MSATEASRNGLLFIACREGIVETPYPDGPYLSIGCGSNGPQIKPDMRWIPSQALAQLRKDVAVRVADVLRLVRVPLRQQELDAITSCHYNRGNRDFPAVIAAVNSGNTDLVVSLLPTFDTNSKGEHLAGLKLRREAEVSVFVDGDYGPLGSIPYWKGDPRRTKRGEYRVQASDLA